MWNSARSSGKIRTIAYLCILLIFPTILVPWIGLIYSAVSSAVVHYLFSRLGSVRQKRKSALFCVLSWTGYAFPMQASILMNEYRLLPKEICMGLATFAIISLGSHIFLAIGLARNGSSNGAHASSKY